MDWIFLLFLLLLLLLLLLLFLFDRWSAVPGEEGLFGSIDVSVFGSLKGDVSL